MSLTTLVPIRRKSFDLVQLPLLAILIISGSVKLLIEYVTPTGPDRTERGVRCFGSKIVLVNGILKGLFSLGSDDTILQLLPSIS